MKKLIAILSAIAMLVTFGTSAFANPSDASGSSLEALINKAKSVIEIPDTYETFKSSQRTDANGSVHWNLNWSTPSSSEYYRDVSGISVDINENGFIEGYSKYGGSYKYSEYIKIPSVSKLDADEDRKSVV